MKNIILIGMPGCGKTTLGRRLAKTLGMDFADCDNYIEQSQGVTVSEIFSSHGEVFFRDLESKTLKQLCLLSDTVIATGGGCVEREENIKTIRDGGIVVFINRPFEDIYSTVDVSNRPLLKNGKDRLTELYERRLPLYKKACHIEIRSRLYPNKMINKIIHEVNSYVEQGY